MKILIAITECNRDYHRDYDQIFGYIFFVMAITDCSCDYLRDCIYKKTDILILEITVVLTVMVVSEFLSNCHHSRHY